MSSPSPVPADFRVFISYSRDDLPLVEPVVSLLRATRDMVFHDVDIIPPGEQWRPALERALVETHLLVVFWCRHAAESEFVRQEYELGMERGKKVLPLLIDDTPLPEKLGAYQWIDFRKTVGPTHAAPPESQAKGAKETRPNRRWHRVPGVAQWLVVPAVILILAMIASPPPNPSGGRVPAADPWWLPIVGSAASLFVFATLLVGAWRLGRRAMLLPGVPPHGEPPRPPARDQHRRMAAELAATLERERAERFAV